ncbi:MAG: hypothetical protein COA66_09465 [Arcobacter sp.]|nr:OmpA family protein [Campylobacteraceae bacterium]NQY30682.1 OmpA family protein [Flavobacteriaceae bacterium]PHR71228.1 MAG: hypothetical protein COA66_09465 [Arcobacter sp.]
MKKFLAYSVLASVLLFTGCSQKSTEMNEAKMNKTEKSSESNLDAMNANNMNQDSMSDSESMTANAIKNLLIDVVYFDFDKFTLNEENRDVAKSNANKLSVLAGKIKIKLEGNSDEWGTDEYNYALGLKRALSVKTSLIDDGISADDISMISFGESNPVCSDKNSTCWKQNRRVEYKILP